MTFREMVLFVSSVVMALILIFSFFGNWLYARQDRLTQTQNVDRSQMIQELNAIDKRLKELESK
jgi:hypothetical protein